MTDNERIHILIERYFEATATDAEEAELKQLLADPATDPTPEVEEARAVMGYTALQKAIHRPAHKSTKRRWTSAAAAAAIMIGIITISYHITDPSDTVDSYATVYMDGKIITSTDEAMAIMQSQLGAIGAADTHSATAKAFSALESMISEE